MPTYGYQCTECGNAFETVQKITDDPLTTCGNCGGILRKKIFPVGISFKGSGFYVNDYAKSAGMQTPAGQAATDAKADTPASGDSAPEKAVPDTSSSAPAPAASPAPAAAGPAQSTPSP